VQRNQLHEVVGVRRVDEREDVLFFLNSFHFELGEWVSEMI
jgi:hypothetical protein